MVSRGHLKGEQGKVLVKGVNNLQMEGLSEGSLRPEEAVEEVAACANQPLQGQGSENVQ